MTGILIRLFGGWRLVRVRGRQAEQLISALTVRGYRMWKVRRYGDELEGLLTQAGYDVLAVLAEELGTEVRSLRQGGLPFRWRQVKGRPFLLAGLATAWLMVLYMTSHIWAIEVVVPNLSIAQQERLIHTAEVSGLRVGASRSHLNIPHIRRLMLQDLPEYSWIGIHTQGMVAFIDAVKLVNRPPNHLPTKLVATASGKVTAVYVYMGAAEVLPGETVQRGQTLISGVVSGELPIQPEGAKKPMEESVVTPAEGQVMADVTYRVKLFQPLRERRLVTTGRVYVERFLELDQSAVVTIPSLGAMPFQRYQVQKNVEAIGFAGVDLPVRLIQIVYNEEVEHTVPLTLKSAAERGRQRALQAMRKRVPRDGVRVARSERIAAAKGGVWVTLTWVMNRNIAVPPGAAKKP
ncbi:MAG: sporulation protein YqfD [Firmicutes bacterium]|nr:sporulation protein YqfD [Bacillota bacterium]